MKNIFKLIILTLIILQSLTGIAFANNNDFYNGVITGKVLTSDNQPAPNATITIKGTLKSTITDEDGDFIFYHLKPGTYEIEISFVGNETILSSVTVENNKTVHLSLQLKISSKELRQVVVTFNRLRNEKTTAIGKANIEVKDLPQAVTIIDKEVMDRQQVASLGDVLMNVPGVYVMGETGGVQQEIAGRGYLFGRTNTFKNGVQFNNAIMPEISSLERVEFLKGSAAILMGNVTAGGVLNLITKKPQFDKGGEISMHVGSYGFYKPGLDIYGPLSDSKSVAFRVNTIYERGNSFREDVHSERFYINPSFLIKAGKKTQLLVEGDYLTDNRTLDYGVGTVNFKINDIPRSRFLGIPWSYNNAQEGSFTITTTRQFNTDWQLRNITAYYNYTDDLFGTTRPGDNGGFTMESNGNWVRGVQRGKVNENYYITQLDLTGKFFTGLFKHQLLFGLSGSKDVTNTLTYNPLTVYDSINVFNLKEYAQRSDIPSLSQNTMTNAPLTILAAYVQDLMSITEKIKLLAGVRFNYAETQSNIFTYSSGAQAGTKVHEQPFTPRFGIVYEPEKNISLFASYSNSFTLNTGVDTSGKALPPSFINQYEVGFKSDIFNKRLTFNVTWYRIVNSNLAQTSLANGNTNSNIKELEGQVTGDGVEVELSTAAINGFNIIAGYSYNHTFFTKSNIYKLGSSLQYTPANTANASIYYTFSKNSMKGFSLGATGLYVAGMDGGKETRLTVANDNRQLIPLPDFAQVDITAEYRFKKLIFGIKVSNLFDALGYYAHEDESINPIAPREYSATVECRL